MIADLQISANLSAGAGLRATTINPVIDGIASYRLCIFDPQTSRPLAHMAEHSVFLGKNRSLVKNIEGRGATLSGWVDVEKTVFCLNTPCSSEAANLSDFLRLTLLGSDIAPHDLEREKRVVLEEHLAEQASPDFEYRSALLGQLLGLRKPATITGTRDSIFAICTEDVQRYCSQKYRPEKSVLVSMSQLSQSEVARIVSSVFEEQLSEPEEIDLGEMPKPELSLSRERRTEYNGAVIPGPGYREADFETFQRFFQMIRCNEHQAGSCWVHADLHAYAHISLIEFELQKGLTASDLVRAIEQLEEKCSMPSSDFDDLMERGLLAAMRHWSGNISAPSGRADLRNCIQLAKGKIIG